MFKGVSGFGVRGCERSGGLERAQRRKRRMMRALCERVAGLGQDDAQMNITQRGRMAEQKKRDRGPVIGNPGTSI
uniref:Uncharacterized protein n=1 Tax=Pristionchus pacificus TaxID=54126 RepID=A0A2A6CE11_PRIPA|eukprot:PDM76442.1 hypothetical protein PRIPAC_40046 [Pristionchus pacificus]